MIVKQTVSICFSDRLTACPVCTTDPELDNEWMDAHAIIPSSSPLLLMLKAACQHDNTDVNNNFLFAC